MIDESRRFTDREVALILRRAAEIDEREGHDASGSLSWGDLRGIAAEVGISPDAVDRAVRSLADRRSLHGLLGAPLVRRAVREMPVHLDEAGLRRLLARVEERTEGAGHVTEALGTVRWTSEDRFASMQVSLAPGEETTTIQVVEKIRPRLRRIFHLMPAAWGAMIAGTAASWAESTTGAAAGLAALGIAGGLALGRLGWTALSARSAARVARLARELAEGTSAAGTPSSPAGHERAS